MDPALSLLALFPVARLMLVLVVQQLDTPAGISTSAHSQTLLVLGLLRKLKKLKDPHITI